MSFYRKRPLVIEARLLTEGNGGELADWSGGRFTGPDSNPAGKPFVVIPTLEGEMVAFPGDWVVKGIKGEFYPVKAAIFEATYEPAALPDDDTPTMLPGEMEAIA